MSGVRPWMAEAIKGSPAQSEHLERRRAWVAPRKAGVPADHEAIVAEVLDQVRARLAAEDMELAEARMVPVTAGPCPGVGVRAYSAGGYETIMCPVCYAAPLGDWPRDDDGLIGDWPATPAHDRQLDD